MDRFFRFACYAFAYALMVYMAVIGLYAMIKTFGLLATFASYAAFGIAVLILDTVQKIPAYNKENV